MTETVSSRPLKLNVLSADSATQTRHADTHHLTAARDEKSHHFAEKTRLQWVEVVVWLQECVDWIEQRLRSDKHFCDFVHVRSNQIARDVWVPARKCYSNR